MSSEPPFPLTGRLLGFDFGSKRLGVAVSTNDQTIASPVENYTRQNPDQDARFVRRLMDEYRPVGLIVGLPVHLSGDEGGKAHEARQFGNWLHTLTGLPVRYSDERYTSMIAEQFLMEAGFTKKQRKARMDMLAAQQILQAYLESMRTGEAPGAL